MRSLAQHMESELLKKHSKFAQAGSMPFCFLVHLMLRCELTKAKLR